MKEILDTAGITVEVNGTERTLPEGVSVRQLLEAMGIDPSESGIAVACNLRIVRRADWSDTLITDGDALEVVTATQGG